MKSSFIGCVGDLNWGAVRGCVLDGARLNNSNNVLSVFVLQWFWLAGVFDFDAVAGFKAEDKMLG
jgi:hypothetical protein